MAKRLSKRKTPTTKKPVIRERAKVEEPFLESCRRRVEQYYAHTKLSSGSVGGCFGSILCSELHHGGPHGDGLDFSALAAKWGIPVTILGELIADHCRRLQPLLCVTHQRKAD